MPKGIHTRVVQQEEARTFAVSWAFRRLCVDCLPTEDLLGRKTDTEPMDGSHTCSLSWVCSSPVLITRVTEQVRLCVPEKGTEFLPIGPFLSLVSGKVEN